MIGRTNLDEPVAEHMRRDVAPLRVEWTVGEALQSLRAADLGDRIAYFYAVEADGTLAGVVPARRLLVSDPATPVRSLLVPRVVSLAETASLQDAVEYFLLYRYLAFPVVDAAGRLVGAIDVGVFTDEVVEFADAREADDIFQLIGVHAARGRGASPWQAFRDRFPWLLANIAGGLLCAWLIGRHEAFLGTALALALFIPVVLALSESVSIQSMSLTLQALHDAPWDRRSFLEALARELGTAILLGGGTGALVGAAAWAWRGHGAVAAAVAVSILLSVATACLLGVALPAVVRALRGDPRIAAGPIVLALADAATILVYFRVAAALL